MEKSKQLKILIVDDHPILRAGVAAIIGARPEMRVAAQAGSGEEALKLFESCDPDVTLMDLRLPGIGGVETIRRMRALRPRARFVVLTTYEGDEDIYQALEAGATGYLIKGMPHEHLIEALQRVAAGGRYIPTPVEKTLAARMPCSELSARERQVLELMAAGRSNRDIAQQLGIAEATVKSHVSAVLLRLGVEDRTQAVVTALQRGLIHL